MVRGQRKLCWLFSTAARVAVSLCSHRAVTDRPGGKGVWGLALGLRDRGPTTGSTLTCPVSEHTAATVTLQLLSVQALIVF